MTNKEINLITKVVSIIGLIFCLTALLTPWSSSAFTFGIFSDKYSAPFYVDFFSNQTILKDVGVAKATTFSVIMIIIFILLLGALIEGIICIKNIDYESPNSYLMVSIFLILSIVLYIFAISILPELSEYTGSTYGAGFATAIIAFIIFFIIYILQFVLNQKPGVKNKIKEEDEAMYLLKLRYVKGEITKEQYEQMKKDLEE